MTATLFVDTNVLIYAVDRADLKKHAAANAWRAHLWATRRGRVSVQVLQEFYAKISTKWPAARDNARAEIMDLIAWNPVQIDTVLIQAGWKIQDRFQLSFWDSLIVAAAKIAGCRYLLTEDLNSGQDLDGVSVINPFSTAPNSL
jgi:predicted nucleic acid-binding protein